MATTQLLNDIISVLLLLAPSAAMLSIVLAGVSLRREGTMTFAIGGGFTKWMFWAVIFLTLQPLLSWFPSFGVAAPLPLDFALLQFSVGTADGRELLAAMEEKHRIVHLLQLQAEVSSGAPTLRSLARLTASDESHRFGRVLLFGRHVLVGEWHESIQNCAVECLPVSGAPLRQPFVLSADRKVWINCWRAACERVLLFDLNHKQLQSLECASLAALSTVLAAHFCCTVERRNLIGARN